MNLNNPQMVSVRSRLEGMKCVCSTAPAVDDRGFHALNCNLMAEYRLNRTYLLRGHNLWVELELSEVAATRGATLVRGVQYIGTSSTNEVSTRIHNMIGVFI